MNKPRIFSDNNDLFFKFIRIRFPKFFIELLSFSIWPIIQLNKIINPIPFIELHIPSEIKIIIFKKFILSINPKKIDPIIKLIAGFILNFDVKIIIIKTAISR